jgi:hypothetical protein
MGNGEWGMGNGEWGREESKGKGLRESEGERDKVNGKG